MSIIDYRTARRLAAHGWGVYSRDTGEGWQWDPQHSSARHIRRSMRNVASDIRDTLTYMGGRQPKLLTFTAENKRWL